METAISDLNVMVIEDSFESRGLLKSHLKTFGVRRIVTSENGTELLTQNEPLTTDVLLIGFGLGYCHSGIELVKALDAAKLLPVWCKVIFITNADIVTSASHPYRYLKCEVLRKPINPQHLLSLLEQACLSHQRFKDILVDLNCNQLTGLSIQLEGVPQGELSEAQRDELFAINMQLKIRMGQGNQAWKLANNIQDELFRATNRLSVANSLGDERKLKMTMKMLQNNPLMERRCMIYQVSQFIEQGQFSEAHELLRTVPSHKYSLAETELCALLKLEAKGLDAAVEFLKFKRGTSLENTFFRNAISLMLVKVYLYQMLSYPALLEEMDDEVEAIQQVYKNVDWSMGKVNFSVAVAGAMRTFSLLCNEYRNDLSMMGLSLSNEKGHDLFAELMAAIVHHLEGEAEEARHCLLTADDKILSNEVSPEMLVNQMWFRAVFDAMVPEPQRAKEYNRIGIHHAKDGNPYPALKMFYLSHKCAQDHTAIAINLLDALANLGLRSFWAVDSVALAKTIKASALRENEKRKFAEVIGKMRQMDAG